MVDPGEAESVEAYLDANQLELTAILVTHHHADHTGGIAALARGRNIPVYGPANEQIAGVTHPLREADAVMLPGICATPLRVMEIPGHTRGHIAYVGDDFVFCGDTLFGAGCGRLFEGTAAQMHTSLQRLASLDDATRVFCTHEYTLSNLRFACAVEPGNTGLAARVFDEQAKREKNLPTLPSTVGLEKATNPFLRTRELEVTAAAAHFARRPVECAAEVFAALRAYKDVY